jgi:hypothetical protein
MIWHFYAAKTLTPARSARVGHTPLRQLRKLWRCLWGGQFRRSTRRTHTHLPAHAAKTTHPQNAKQANAAFNSSSLQIAINASPRGSADRRQARHLKHALPCFLRKLTRRIRDFVCPACHRVFVHALLLCRGAEFAQCLALNAWVWIERAGARVAHLARAGLASGCDEVAGDGLDGRVRRKSRTWTRGIALRGGHQRSEVKRLWRHA